MSGGVGERAGSVVRTAVVVGGGIAGIACALRLAERGVAVTLLETRKKLGGRATSFQDVRSGQWLDNCQHVVLGCCTNYLDLLGRLGTRDAIVWHREQYWVEQGGRVSVVRPGPLPAPAHFTGSFLAASFLSIPEKLGIARACSAIMRANRAQWDGRTFGEFLRSRGQTDRVIARFWSPVVVSACNLGVASVSAASALHVFQDGFLAARTAADIGVPGVPLLALYERAELIIRQAGGVVHLGRGVERIDERGAIASDGTRHDADRVVCAVPVERVNRLIAPDIRERDPRFTRLDEFTHSPIVGVHLTFDAPMMPDWPHAVLVDRPTQWLFRKNNDGSYLHAVISAADAWVALSEEEIGERVMKDVRACLPRAQRPSPPKLLSVRTVKEKLATFAPRPGVEALRPAVAGPSSIILAGDYTSTGWPATMEGATRSGYAAAAAALGQPAAATLVPALPVAPLARLAGL